MQTTNFIAQAAADYRAAQSAYAAIPFDFGSAIAHPEPPTETPEARAGAMIAEMGLIKALVRCVGLGLSGSFEEPSTGNWWRMVATYVIGAAQEVE
jgi:hypothetical protein